MGYQKNMVLQKQFLWDADQTNLAADSRTLTGTIAIFSAPANCAIKSIKAHVITAVTGATSEIVGDGTDTNGFLEDGFAANAGYYPLHVQEVSATFAGAFTYDSDAGVTDAADVSIVPKDKFYSSADTIDFVIGGTASAGKIRFVVEFMAL